MDEKKQIFRKVSLERLSSPEQLDQLMQVTSPKSWIALLSVLGLLVVAFSWSILGRVSTTAAGTGILLGQGGVTTVVSASSGQLEELLVEVGDTVREGDVVARVRQEPIERQLAEAEARRAAAAADVADLESFVSDQRRLAQAGDQQKRANLERSIGTFERQVEILTRNLEVQRGLLAGGLVTQQTVLATEDDLNRARDQLAAQRLELDGLGLVRLEDEQRLRQQLTSRRAELRDFDLAVAEKRAQLEESVRVVASADGRVLELAAGPGDVISPGSPVLTMELSSDELLAVLFVPAEIGKKVVVGMPVRVSPSTVKAEEHGFLLGWVVRVAEYPATARGMARMLSNESLARTILDQGPALEVDVLLLEDSTTPTGYRWSSSQGPDLEISSGTLIGGSVIVEQTRPIELVVPAARRLLGLEAL